MNRALVSLIALLTISTSAAPLRADTIDQIVQSEMKRQHSPAIGIAVVRNGHVLKVKGYGYANLELHSPATTATFFQTASMGKQFTATLVMLLVRDGKLKLDVPVSTYLSGAPDAWKGITVRQLLTHTSGLDRTDAQIDLRKDYGEEELLASAYKVPILSAPGEKYSYSNLGYQVLGILCSRVGGKFYGEQMRERMFHPLGMRSRVISERDLVPGRAAGYDRVDGVIVNQAWVAPSQNTTADGSFYVTPQDMALWSIALDRQQLITKAEEETMWAPATLNDGQRVDYGFGWKLFEMAGHRQVRHRGDWQGFTTHILHMPQDRLTVTVLMNRSNAQPHVIVDRIAALYIPELTVKPAVPPAADVLLRTPMFVRGSMNDWKDTAPMIEVQPGRLQARIKLAVGMQQFKLGDRDWRVADLGARLDEVIVRPGRTQSLEFQGEDLYLQVDTPGEYTFQLDLRAKGAPIFTVFPAQAVNP